jgi:predicted Ser/Thr protein kinase
MKPRNIGRYQIKAELNRGGMSVVYLAHDPNIGRDVAIKVLPRSLPDQAAARKRFEREVHAVAMLDHPAIVPIYDFGEEDGQPYIVMRYMPGGSLADMLTYGRLNLSDAARILERKRLHPEIVDHAFRRVVAGRVTGEPDRFARRDFHAPDSRFESFRRQGGAGRYQQPEPDPSGGIHACSLLSEGLV